MPDHHKLPRVAFVSHGLFPSDDVYSHQILKNISALSSAGLPITLIIPVPAKRLFQRRAKIIRALFEHYNIPDAMDIRIIGPVPAIHPPLQLHRFVHPFAALLYAAFKGYDIIYTRDEFTLLLCLLTGRKIIFETYKDIGGAYPLLLRLLALMSKKKRFIGAVLHSRFAADLMARGGVDSEKLFVIHNGFDPGDMKPVLDRDTARKLLGMDKDGFCVAYAGSLRKDKGVELVIDIASILKDKRFLLLGGTSENIRRLHHYMKDKGVSNISIQGQKPIKDVAKYLYASDVLIIPPAVSSPSGPGKTILPIKIFMYAAAGKPIVAPDRPDVREILSNGETALLVDPENPDAYVSAIEQLAGDPDCRKKLSNQTRRLSESMTWGARAEKIINVISQNRSVRC